MLTETCSKHSLRSPQRQAPLRGSLSCFQAPAGMCFQFAPRGLGFRQCTQHPPIMGSESVEEMSVPILRKKPAVAPDLAAGYENQAPGNTGLHSTAVENHRPDVNEILKAVLFGWIPKARLSNRRGPGAKLGRDGKTGETPSSATSRTYRVGKL